MPIMSKNQKYLVMLALLAGAAPAAVVAQDQAQDAPPADVSASVAMPAAELTEGPEIKGIISARSGDRMQVTAADGREWQVDLGNPNQTQRSGFTGESAKTGDALTVLGNRNSDLDRAHIKAVRITIAGTNYDMYPERIVAD